MFAVTAAAAMARSNEGMADLIPKQEGDLAFYDVRGLGLEGQGWNDVEEPFDRLPSRMKDRVRPRIWDLSKNPAGLCVRFMTNATEIHARWTVGAQLAMNHMPATGVSGLDLYVRDAEGRWRRLGTGAPEGATTMAPLARGLTPKQREYLLYLPLYNTVASVEIAIPAQAQLEAAPPRPSSHAQPIVVYGTSITQGGCASRPGMCHTAILGRRFDRPVINLGFSGNGTMDPELAELLTELDPAMFVIDCLPNMNAAMVSERAEPFVKRLRLSHPTTPIVLVEDRTFGEAFLIETRRKDHGDIRRALRRAFDNLTEGGDAHLFYIAGDELLAADGEDTVDGSHPTDLGFVHMADAFEPVLKRALNAQ